VWAEGSAPTRCADAVAPGLATFTQELVITRILRYLQLSQAAVAGERSCWHCERAAAASGGGGVKMLLDFLSVLLRQRDVRASGRDTSEAPGQ
jgi:hypothetical protein